MRRRRDVDPFFQAFTSGVAVEDALAAEGWDEAEAFFAELTGARPAAGRAFAGAEDTGEAAPGPLDAAVILPSGKAYFFYGADYVRYDVKADKADPGYPKPIKGNWPGLWEKDVDAGIEWGNGKLYFFKGGEYFRYDIAADKVDPGFPKPIKGNWPGLFEKDIDAAVNWGNGKAYFFKGGQYIRYDIAKGTADAGYPKAIAGNWPGLFTADIDDAVNWGNGKAYFFKGDEYSRYDMAADKVDAGYPTPIAGKWPGLHPASTCTCTDSGRKYSSGLVPTADLIGAEASIKTRYGKLCCEGTTATSWAFTSAWTGVTRPGTPMMWAQIGYRRMRTVGGTAIKTYRYWEVFGTVYNSLFEPSAAPADNAQHTYRCEVDTSSGKWSFDVDGTNWKTFTDAAWVGKTGTRADYVGEIMNETDDMPGTDTNKCTFRDCKKKSTGGAYVAAGLTTANVSSSNAAEWGATRISATGMDIWDKNPNP
jgi:hypothetical protein